MLHEDPAELAGPAVSLNPFQALGYLSTQEVTINGRKYPKTLPSHLQFEMYYQSGGSKVNLKNYRKFNCFCANEKIFHDAKDSDLMQLLLKGAAVLGFPVKTTESFFAAAGKRTTSLISNGHPMAGDQYVYEIFAQRVKTIGIRGVVDFGAQIWPNSFSER